MESLAPSLEAGRVSTFQLDAVQQRWLPRLYPPLPQAPPLLFPPNCLCNVGDAVSKSTLISINSAEPSMADLTISPTVQVGKWISLSTTLEGTTVSYLSTNITEGSDEPPSVVFLPQFTTSGNYSVSVYTPGCIDDVSCAIRGNANVTSTLSDEPSTAPAVAMVAQTNDYGKFDQVYYGFVNATSDSFQPSITMTPESGQSMPLNFVVQQARFELISTEETSSSSSSNSSSTAESSPPYEGCVYLVIGKTANERQHTKFQHSNSHW